MTAKEILQTVASMPREDWIEIQRGIADLLTANFSANEVDEIREALNEAEAEYNRGEGLSSEMIRKQLGLL